MKIEKISDNQIRCTLTRADLADRQLQLSELAYGTEKAKSLVAGESVVLEAKQTHKLLTVKLDDSAKSDWGPRIVVEKTADITQK